MSWRPPASRRTTAKPSRPLRTAGSLLADEELTQPTVFLIGDYLRAKLPAGS
jgi:hypothetical protein